MATRSYTINGVVDSAKLESSIKKTVTNKIYTITVKADGTQVKQLTKQIETVTEKNGDVIKTISQLNKKTGELEVKAVKTTNTLKNTSVSLKDLATNFTDIIKKVTLFGSATAIIGLFTSAVVEAISVVKDFDSAITDFKKVSDLSGDSLDEYTQQLGELGETVARTTTQMVESATEFKKSGYSDEDSAQLARIAEMYKNIADAELSSSESAGFIISQMKAYGNETESFAQHTIDAVNNISNNMAVSSSDVSEGLTKSASGMSALGNSFEETASLVSAGSEIMTNQASKVSRGLMTIGNNIAKLAQASDTMTIATKNGAKSIELINSETGDLNSTYKVLEQISDSWEDMSDAQRTNLAITLAGKNQFAVFNSVVGNFADAQKSLTLALNSAGSAEQENAKYMDSLQGKTAQLQQQFQKLVLGDGGLQDFAKKLIDVGTAILKFVNNTDALKVLFVDLSLILAIKLIPKFVTWIATMKTAIGEAMLLYAETGSLSASLETLGITASTTQLALGGLIAVVSLGVMIWNSYKASQEQARQEAIDALNTYKSEESQLEILAKKVQDENASKQSLIQTMSQLDSSYDAEKAQLKDINDLRQEAIEKLYEEAKVKAQQTLRETGSEAEKARKDLSSWGGTYELGLKFNAFEDIELISAITKNANTDQEALDSLNEKIDYYNKLIEEGNELTSIQRQNFDTISKARNILSSEVETQTELVNENDQAQKIANSTLEEWLNIVQESNEETSDNNNSLEEEVDITEELADALSDLNSQLDSIQSMFSDLQSAYDEYNENGYISIDTYQKLLSYGNEYLALLMDEHGNIIDNVDAVNSLYKAKIDELAITKARSIIDTARQNTEDGVSFRNLASSIDLATKSLWDFIVAEQSTSDINALNLKQAKILIGQVDEWRKQAISSIGVQNSVTKSISNTNTELDKLKDKLKEYDTVISYIKDKVKSYVNEIEEQRDAQLDSIDAQIEALKEQQDIEEQYWQDKIDALKEQNDAIQDQIDLQTLLDNLAKAKTTKKKVYREGQGFVYETDKEEVSKAQLELDKYYREKSYNDQLKALEDYKNKVSNNYDNQIKDLEDYQDKIKKDYQKQIDYYNDWLDEFQNGVDSYENEQNRLKAIQLTGIDFEKQGWQTRITNLRSFLQEYTNLQKQISSVSASGGSSSSSGSSGNLNVSKSTSTNRISDKPYWVYRTLGSYSSMGEANSKVGSLKGDATIKGSNGKYLVVKYLSGYETQAEATSRINYYNGNGVYKRYATGTYGVKDDQIAIVGDNPNSNEIAIGSKLNNGNLMSLQRGTGIIPHNLTSTLVQMASAFNNNSNLVPNTNNSQVISIGNISLPNVQNGQDFVDYLQNFSTSMTQLAYSRK